MKRRFQGVSRCAVLGLVAGFGLLFAPGVALAAEPPVRADTAAVGEAAAAPLGALLWGGVGVAGLAAGWAMSRKNLRPAAAAVAQPLSTNSTD